MAVRQFQAQEKLNTRIHPKIHSIKLLLIDFDLKFKNLGYSLILKFFRYLMSTKPLILHHNVYICQLLTK